MSGAFHPGAVIDFRWVGPTPSDTAGQQCTYDNAGRLITRGPGAGTPDIHSPRVDTPESIVEHKENDIKPLNTMALGAYLERWQPNKGLQGDPADRALGRAKGACEENPQGDPPFSRLP